MLKLGKFILINSLLPYSENKSFRQEQEKASGMPYHSLLGTVTTSRNVGHDFVT